MKHFMEVFLLLSVSGSVLAILLFALRPFLKRRVSKRFLYYIWIPVLLRFLIPFGYGFSLPEKPLVSEKNPEIISELPKTEELPKLRTDEVPADTISVEELSRSKTEESVFDVPKAATIKVQRDDAEFWKKNGWNLLFIVWLSGAVLHLLYSVLSYFSYKKVLCRSLTLPKQEENEVFRQTCDCLYKKRAEKVWHSVRLVHSKWSYSPMLLGLFSPMLVLPERLTLRSEENSLGLSEEELSKIFCHELVHRKRRDIGFKWFVMFFSCLHWFNPLASLIRRVMETDCELACDEAVLRTLDDGEQRAYGALLLRLSKDQTKRHIGLPAAFCGYQQLKTRVKGICEYQKRTRTSLAVTLIFGLLLTGCSAGMVTLRGENEKPKIENEEVKQPEKEEEKQAEIENVSNATEEKETKVIETVVQKASSAKPVNEIKGVSQKFLDFYQELNGEDYSENIYRAKWREDFDINNDGKNDLLLKTLISKYGYSDARLELSTEGFGRGKTYYFNQRSKISYEIMEDSAKISLEDGSFVTVKLPETDAEQAQPEEIYVRFFYTETSFCNECGKNVIRIREKVCYRTDDIEIAEIITYYEVIENKVVFNHRVIWDGQEVTDDET